jgi:hypothetical protein
MAIPQANKAVVAVALVAAGLALYWLWARSRPTPPPPMAPPAQVAAPPVSVSDAKVEPQQVRHPIERAGRRSSEMPSLDDSDRAMRDGMGGLFGAKRLAEFFVLEGIISRIVATVDNLPRDPVPLGVWPLTPVTGDFLVQRDGAGLAISAKNSARYESRVRLAESVEPRKLVALYIRYYPLFQRAYEELGNPHGYFNDRLVDAIDDMLATPELAGPFRLVKPHARYEFADPALQARSAGQKLLLRMGPQHASRLKVVLREIRQGVTGQNLP